MATVETVRGPVELDRLGRTLMHEHVFVFDPEAHANYAHIVGEDYWDEEVRVADAIAKLRRMREGGIETIVDPTAYGLGRNIPRIQRDQRRSRREHRRCDRRVRVPRAARFPRLSRGRLGHRAVRPRAARGHRRHRRARAVHQVRGRALRPHRRHPAHPHVRRCGGGRDRRAGDGAHERTGEDRPARARSAHVEGCRPEADRDRARRRQQRPRLPARDRGHRRVARLRPVQHPPLQPGPRSRAYAAPR